MFAGLLAAWGQPPLWNREPGFATLVHIVMEQKISLASARAVMQRIESLCPRLLPEAFLALEPAALREAGASDAKIGYCRSIASAIIDGSLPLDAFEPLEDAAIMATLVRVRGIGPWTAGVYLTMALCRPDAWPSGDRALAVGVAEAFGLDAVPDYRALDVLADDWRPLRGAASRLIWHAYLGRRGRVG